MRDDVAGYLLRAPAEVAACVDVAGWWPRHREVAAVWRNPMDRAIAGGFAADRVGWAFASGYQAALHALLPAVPEDRVAALCVTETDGNGPKAIKSTLRRDGDGWILDGAKRWSTLGPDGALFFVAARDAAVSGERTAIRVARVPSDAPGLTVQAMPPTPFIPEVPHAELRFARVCLPDCALLPGDGYADYVKRFRTAEDLHVNAAILAYVVREARRLAWPAAWIERALATLEALRAIALENLDAPATHIALAGALDWSSALIQECDVLWSRSPRDPAAARWLHDRELLGVGRGLRARRRERAWERVSATSPAA